ncbi:hypothetical protein [Candidatus Parabeggiatoa sp. HSG14]|uniref:hypothetical protein n=1 Tax=Candidatus Parabeggiatoa sp. HSG14 TaxID=3055593 RepID=UPI0025A85F2F|nr:hypothetical protein [Thiotrichales bacterium HSG14]
MFNSKLFNFVVFFIAGLLLTNCSLGPPTPDQDAQKNSRVIPKDFTTGSQSSSPKYLLEVEDPNSGKMYVFTDSSRYQDYLKNGELPSGKAVNLGQTSMVLVGVPEDSSAESTGVYQLYQGKVKPKKGFYVQRLVNSPSRRFYVFSSPDLLDTPVADLPIQKSSVDGPNGELVIYSLQGTDFYSLQKKFIEIQGNQ